MFEQFTEEARQTVSAAIDEAHDLGHDFVGTEHQLLGLLRVQHGLAYEVLDGNGMSYDAARSSVMMTLALAVDDEALAAIGIDADKVRRAAEASFGPGALERAVGRHRHGKRTCGTAFTGRAKKVLELSLREALNVDDHHIGTEHLLLALVREGDGVAAQVLRHLAPDTDFRQLLVERSRRAS